MRIINISGKAEHGKDTLAKILKTQLEEKDKKVIILHYGDYLKFLCKVLYGWNGEKDEYGRHLLQNFGTNKVRTNFPAYWVEAVERQVSLYSVVEEPIDYVLIPDCRFPNEIEWWEDNGFMQESIRVIRLNHKSKLTEEQLQHPSETALDDYSFDYELTAEDIQGLEDGAENLVWLLETNRIFPI